MIDKQQTAIFKSNQDFNKNEEKISQYIKYTENWQVASVMYSYMHNIHIGMPPLLSGGMSPLKYASTGKMCRY